MGLHREGVTRLTGLPYEEEVKKSLEDEQPAETTSL